jgi:hypothetical protein
MAKSVVVAASAVTRPLLSGVSHRFTLMKFSMCGLIFSPSFQFGRWRCSYLTCKTIRKLQCDGYSIVAGVWHE